MSATIELPIDGYSVTSKSSEEVHKKSKDGLNWTVNSLIDNSINSAGECVYVVWKFDWTELTHIIGFKGVITSGYGDDNKSDDCMEINVNLTRSCLEVERLLGSLAKVTDCCSKFSLRYGFKLTSILFSIPRDELVFSQIADVTLLVQGCKIRVNKGFLSTYSEYFLAMFNSNFKESSMAEIPIEDVDYDDFVYLMRVIHPDPVYPTTETAEMLLELADLFAMPGVVNQVENYLKTSDMRPSKILYLSDKFKITKLSEKCMDLYKTTQSLKRLGSSQFIDFYSTQTLAKLFKSLAVSS